MNLAVLSWLGILLCVFGFVRGSELMIASGVILCAISAAAARVIERIEKSINK